MIPVHNESSHLRETLEVLSKSSPVPIAKFVLAENGSTDTTVQELQKLNQSNPEKYEFVQIPQADFGLALRAALSLIAEMKIPPDQAEQTWVHFNGADIPFGTSDIAAFRRLVVEHPKAVMFIGSKFHPNSQVERHWKRTLASQIFFWLRFFMTGMKYRDTQGTLFFKWGEVARMAPALQTQGFITTTEMVYWLHRQGREIVEIPVVYGGEKRPSSVRLVRSGKAMLSQLVKLRKIHS